MLSYLIPLNAFYPSFIFVNYGRNNVTIVKIITAY